MVADGQVLSSSFLPTGSPTTPGVSTHLQVPAAGSTAATYLSDGHPTPGMVTADQLVAASPTPTPTPPATPSLPPYVHAKPVIAGDAAVGNTLSVDPGKWIPYDTSLGLQWYADEVPIPGATGTSLKLSGKLNGSLITVAVTGWYDGYSATVTSDPTAPVGSSKGNH